MTNIEVIICGFGRRNIKKIVDKEDLKKTPIKDIINTMIKEEYLRRNLAAYKYFMRWVKNTRGYISVEESIRFIRTLSTKPSKKYMQKQDRDYGETKISRIQNYGV